MDALSFQRSHLLTAAGVRHGFSLRAGGFSREPYSSLNLGYAVGDDREAVDRNLAALALAAGLPASSRAIAAAVQVHGDRVLAAQAGSDGHRFTEVFPESQPSAALTAEEAADAVLALEQGVAVGVRVADCVPLLLHDPGTGAAAAVHSGWRGTRLRIAARAVRALQHTAGTDPKQVLAAVGPCIGRCCYEVSKELANLFRDHFGAAVADDPREVAKPHLDLRACVAAALASAGVPEERIEQVPGCTSCDAASYFSHRRDQGRTGRHLAFVVAGRSL